MMRNRWGVEVKTGDFVTVRGPRGQIFEGVVDRMSFKSAYAKAYGPQLYLVDGGAFGIDDVVKVVPKAKKNPLSRTSVAADSQRERVSVSAKGRATKTKSPSRRLMARRRTTEKAPAGFYANPLTRVKVNSPSMATGEPPSTRLIKRRKKTVKGPVGVWANPIQDFKFAGVIDDSGFDFGMDAVTPVTWLFSSREKKRGMYLVYQLPANLQKSKAFQSWARGLIGSQWIGSKNELVRVLKAFVE